ncbi:YcjF family protein [Cyanobium sp. NIES-981]|uniref:YcjF family protein n=1 Tax=Cyanobium sp. NIES-981 TaxID=1851505 RepID=UPI0007DD452F|nr:YcjF family protein [Cyanobium sp. NIES-981]SBO42449.1 Membrane associated GTPase [Cyanobium sp. NIES-981]
MTPPLPSGPDTTASAFPPSPPPALRLLGGGVSRWWPLGLAVVGGGVVLDGLGHLSQLPLASAGTGALGLAALWWFGRRPAGPPSPGREDVTGWLRRLDALQGQFLTLEAETSGTVAGGSGAGVGALERTRALEAQRRLIERPGLTIGVAGTAPFAEERRPLLAEGLRGSAAITLNWAHPLASWSTDWVWPEPFQAAEVLLYWLRTPLTAADLRWLEALPDGLPAWLLVEHGADQDPEALRQELTAQLALRCDHSLLLWEPATTPLAAVLAPLARQLGRDAASLRRQRQLRGLRSLHDSWQADLETLRRQRFQLLQQRTQWLVAAGVVAAPLPSLDVVVLAVANGLMLQEMARLWQCPWSGDQLRAAATELAKASLALGVVEWSTQMLCSLIRLHGATWLVGSAVQALSAAYLTRVVGRAMADVLALSAGVREPDLERIKREAPLLVARAAEAEKLDWNGFLQQGRQWWSAQRLAATGG